MKIEKASRKKVKIKMALSGKAGSGKTKGALKIARGIAGDWNEVLVICSENKSAALYSHLGPYDIIYLDPPYSPERFIQAIKLREAHHKVLIIDSSSAEWEGTGGILEIHGNMEGNSFTNWKSLTPRHRKFLDTILQVDAHVILTLREKTEYVLEANERGKQTPKKVGTTEIQRAGFEYEMTLVLKLNGEHYAKADKDRTELFSNRDPFELTEEVGKEIAAWCSLGVELNPEPAKYTGTNDDKALLKQTLLSLGVPAEDKNFMRMVHEKCLGVLMADMANIVLEMTEAYKNKGQA